MNTRFLKQAFVLLLCSLFFAGTALWLVSVKEPRSYGGEPVFAKTLQNLDNLGRLTIETPKTVVNLQLRQPVAGHGNRQLLRRLSADKQPV